MSQPAVSARGVVETSRRLLAGRRLAGRFLALPALAGLVLAGLVTTDVLFPFADGLRPALLPAAVAVIAVAAVAAALARVLAAGDPDAARRTAELSLDDRQRYLSAAVDLEARGGELATAAARRWLGRLALDELPRRLPAIAWRCATVVVGACLVAALACSLLAPRLLPTVWQRLADPFGDHPPYSPTLLAWAEVPERVRVGADVACHIEWSQTPPPPGTRFRLLAETADGAQLALPMHQIGERRYAARLEHVSQVTTLWAEGAGTRTHRHRLDLDPVPEIAGCTLTLRSPAYARLEDEVRTWQPGQPPIQFEALPGSQLLLAPTANRPLAAIDLAPTAGDDQRLDLDAGQATWPTATGAWSLSVVAADGIASDPAPLVEIAARADAAPRLTYLAPGRDAVATVSTPLPLHLQVSDDLGLQRLARVRGLANLDAPATEDFLVGRQADFQRILDLTALGLAPGDILTLTAIAWDHHPGGGQASPVVRRQVRIISEQEYNQLLRRQLTDRALEAKYRPLLERMKALRKRLQELHQAGPDAPGRSEREKAWQAELASLQEAVAGLGRDQPLFAIEPDLQQAMAEALDELAQAAAEDRPPGDDRARMLAEDLDLLRHVARARALVARLRQIADAEQQTVERLENFARHRRLSPTDRLRLRRLGDEEAQLAEALETWRRLARKLRDDLEPLPGTAPLDQALGELDQALGASGAIEDKHAAAAACRAGDGAAGRQHAARARDRLLELMRAGGRCDGIGAGMCLGLSWSADPSLALGQLAMGAGLGYGFGLGGSGMAGLGLGLGYGGDNPSGTLAQSPMDLFGPENLGGLGGLSRDDSGDGVAAMAGPGGDQGGEATAYERATRRSRSGRSVHLDPDQQALVDRYFQALEE